VVKIVSKMRGDLSAPVLAIIVTIGLISAGLILLAWFWWFAPEAGKSGVLVVTGQPAIICTAGSVKESHAYISVKNIGNSPVKIEQVVIAGYVQQDSTLNIVVNAGESKFIEIEMPKDLCSNIMDARAVEGVLVTNSGIYSATFSNN
jgi:hypothetical protein